VVRPDVQRTPSQKFWAQLSFPAIKSVLRICVVLQLLLPKSPRKKRSGNLCSGNLVALV